MPARDVILLKNASVIGNIFDIDKLNNLSPFNNVTMTDLRVILLNLERDRALEVLYDREEEKMICKFNIPFMREVLYQRMLIEQRSDLHLKVANLLKSSTFSYMSQAKELSLMKKHLNIGEKDVMDHLNDNDENYSEGKTLSEHNLKLVLQKKIQCKLKEIQKEKDPLNSIIMQGYMEKKSDANFSWER